MSLARAESRRLFKRRFTKLIVIGALLVLAATVAGTWFSNEKVGATQVASAKAQADRDYQEAVRQSEQEMAKCQAAPPTTDGVPCSEQVWVPTPDQYDYTWYMPATFDLRSEFPNMISVLAVVLAGAAFLIGASFVGSEWSSGGMMNLLLWRPQRVRVLSTKLTVFLSWLTGLTLLLLAAWAGIFQLVAEVRGSTEKMTAGVWQSFGLTGLRALALVLVAGALGFALASLGRHTGMALGALVGLGALQIGVYVMANLAEFKFTEAWVLPVWGYAWLDKELVLEDFRSCDYSATAGCELDKFTMTWQTAGIGMAIVVALVVGAAMWTMRKRDIT
ncbi:ABC-type transport system involved in multi-copper enzyme maturation permease subunit [Actinoplanes lutulentus]|uniref:ABC-type transport system involved in multi-copper enzyme maturation permease subunit n=1 Tax=Actinoplanes lutulentus TaxID=1287878 RepID=A0A327ZC50_9ACTN|nr:ABC transporter permease [Actinoplanes lutulentus]MBB2945779.1 ABC-type transport system involved in multi-copper enzyme maturation permease subunit [Actinoplanes lutulentus]RAK37828.1 ABC-type transport system involved in multi-copper enzyme maturation permease subunit [Actinoplanes lutulentus]